MKISNSTKERFNRLFPRPKVVVDDNDKSSFAELLSSLSYTQWAYFFTGFFCWCSDSFAFYSVSMTLTSLSVHFDLETHHITHGLTLSQLFRPLGAALFGVFSDRFGRKWPLVANMLIISVIELATVYCTTYLQFLITRALFGIGMGGVWGLGGAWALENLPTRTKGLFSGLFHSGWCWGVIFCVMTNLLYIERVKSNWMSLYYIASGFSASMGLAVMLLPESAAYLEKKRALNEKAETKQFSPSLFEMLKNNKMLCLWAITIFTGLSGLSGGSYGIFPQFLSKSKKVTEEASGIILIMANLAGVLGPSIGGSVSQIIGRKLTLLFACIWALCTIPFLVLPSSALHLGIAYALYNFGIHGGFGVMPIYMNELAPEGFKATFPGVVYQFGTMFAAPATFLEALYGDTHPTHEGTPDYGTAMILVLSIAASTMFFMLILGNENADIRQENVVLYDFNSMSNLAQKLDEASLFDEESPEVKIK